MPPQQKSPPFVMALLVATATIIALSYTSITVLQNAWSAHQLPHAIRLRSATIDTSVSPWRSSHSIHSLTNSVKQSIGAVDTVVDHPAQVFLQFKRPLRPEEMQTVETALGVKLQHHVPDNAFVVYTPLINRIMDMIDTDTTLHDVIHWVGRVLPEHKSTIDYSTLQQEQDNITEEKETHHPIGLYAVLVDRNLIDENDIAQWELQLASEGISKQMAHIRRTSATKLSVYIAHLKHAQQVLDFLKQKEQIMWIETIMPHEINNGGSKAIIQTGAETSFDLEKSTILYRNGITGRGQIVAVGDTGIDHDMCFFHDSKVATPIDRIDTNHRKIVGYKTVRVNIQGKFYQSDDKDTVDGHGTHVTGSVAGRILEDHANATKLTRFNGMAKDAKLLFIDLLADDSPGLLIPDDLAENYYPMAYQGGARIHSNSWGCSTAGLFRCVYDCQCTWIDDTPFGKKGQPVPERFCVTQFGTPNCCQACNQYNSQTEETDRFLYENDDHVILFAAGNDGITSREGSVTSPATSKNTITVGASMNNNDALLESISHEDFAPILQMLRLTSTEQCCQYTSGDKTTEMLVKSLCCPSFMKQQYENTNSYNQENLASFSSRGPAVNGKRIRPDVVAPGMKIQSMHSDGSLTTHQCGIGEPKLNNDAAILTSQGTSMATPIVAGATALVRNYFMDGYYPSGEPQEKDSMEPSGYLVKATVIHAAVNQQGTVVLDGTSLRERLPKSYPNNLNGFGLLQLDSALKLKITTDPAREIEMHVYDKQVMEHNGQSKKLCFTNTGALGTIRATMAWYDPPSAVNADGDSILVNNLDLDAYLYNSLDKDAKHVDFFPGNGNMQGDDHNPVSQIRDVQVAQGKNIVFVVSAINLKKAPQKYALVITGPKGLVPMENCDVAPERPARGKMMEISWEILAYVAFGVICLALVGILVAFVVVVSYKRYLHDKRLAQQHSYGEPLPMGNSFRGEPSHYYSS